MHHIFKALGFGKKSDFAAKVLNRYNSKKPVSAFARELFRSETAESLNERFAQAKREVSR